MKLIIILLYILIFTLIFFMIYEVMKKHKKEKIEEKLEFLINEKDKSYKKFNSLLKSNKEGYFSYERIERYLRKLGNPLGLSPGGYIVCKFLISIILLLVCISSKAYIEGIILAILGYLIIDILFKYSDKRDMKKIRLELADVYDLLNIQTSAGVFMGEALSEAYLIVSHKRFKKALAELSAEINLKKNIEQALDNFSGCFNSVEIEGLIMTIKQSLLTGQAYQALDDMSDSLKEMNLIAIQAQTESVKSTKNYIQLLMFLGILAMIIYGLGIEIGKSWSSLF